MTEKQRRTLQAMRCMGLHTDNFILNKENGVFEQKESISERYDQTIYLLPDGRLEASFQQKLEL